MARKVSFNDCKQVTEVETVSNDERNTVWYTRQDLEEIRHACQNNTASERNAEVDCDAVFHTFDQQRQKELTAAILKQQLEHRQLGMSDPKGLFQLSKAFSKKAKLDALKAGRAQANEVMTYREQQQQTINIIDDALELLRV